MYRILTTEKPSVAHQYAEALKLKKVGKTDGYIEGHSPVDNVDYKITWAVGHLVTMSYPQEYDEKYKKWNLEDIPFLPSQYKYEVIADKKKQFGIIKKLYNAPDSSEIYYAGDSGREGIYIQMLIRALSGCRKGVTERVVWIDSQTEEEILNGIRTAKPVSEYQLMTDSAYMRAIEDYAVGINFSRALSCKFGYQFNHQIKSEKYKPISVGRVMTCVLGMIVKREREIRDFKETLFYKPTAVCEGFQGQWKAMEGTKYFNSPAVYNSIGFFDESNAEAFVKQLTSNPILAVEKAISKKEIKYAPPLYNLAEIQSDCTKLFKISPDTTLGIIQKLYEEKLVTYPRTDARVLSIAISKEITKNLNGIIKMGYKADEAQHIIATGAYKGIESNKRYCDDSKITDHYAIIPTGQGSKSGLNELETNVYQLIVRRFLAIFYPPAEYRKTELTLKHQDNEYFFATAKELRVQGYLCIENKEVVKPDSILTTIKQGNVINTNFTVTDGKTNPPKRFSSGSIILAMENAGNLIEDVELRAQIKSCGIGTSSTRAEIIKKLASNGYIKLNNKTQILTPETAGEFIYDIANEHIPSLLSPKMTASWEKGLSQINSGKITKEKYSDILNNYIIENVKKVKAQPSQDFSSEVVGKCPFCGGDIVTTKNGYKCTEYKKEAGCNFYTSNKVSLSNLNVLLSEGKTGIIKGFINKEKKKFDAAVKLDPITKSVKFDFPKK